MFAVNVDGDHIIVDLDALFECLDILAGQVNATYRDLAALTDVPLNFIWRHMTGKSRGVYAEQHIAKIFKVVEAYAHELPEDAPAFVQKRLNLEF